MLTLANSMPHYTFLNKLTVIYYLSEPMSSSGLTIDSRGGGKGIGNACVRILHVDVTSSYNPRYVIQVPRAQTQGRVRVEEANKTSAVAVFLLS